MKRILFALSALFLFLFVAGCSAAPATKNFAAPQSPNIGLGAAPPPAPTSAPAVGGRDATGSQVPAESAARMIVYTVNLSLEVKDTDKAVNDITAIVSRYKGYVSAANLSRNSSDRLYGTITVRVPAESLDAAQKEIEAAGLRVLSRSKASNDVTDQYTDLNARLTNLQATEDELRKLLDTVRERTGKAEDILAIYNQLTQIRGQIEQIKGQMNVLSKTSDMATMTIQLTPQLDVVEPDQWLPNETARQSLRTLVQALQRLTDLAIVFVLLIIPLLIIVLLPFVILALIIRAVTRRRAKPKAATTA